MMEDFGAAGIQSIDSMYYSIGTEKQDIYKKPSTGMFKRCEKEWPNIKFAKGWYVGHTIHDAKAAFKIKARPVLINPTEDTLKKLRSFANQKIAKRTKIFPSLLEFAYTLK
jgi:histidinol phosphatase-like enzyme